MADLVLNWGSLGEFGTNLEPTQTVDTGGVNVTVGFTPQDEEASAVTFNAPGYVGPGEGFNDQSFLKLDGQGGEGGVDETSVTTLDFSSNDPLYSDTVQNVSFRINDIDGGGNDIDPGSSDHADIVTVRAYDADGNEVPVTFTPGSDVTASGNTLSGGDDNAAYTDGSASTLVSIDGPVAYIEIEYANGDTGEQTVMVSDVCFSTVDNEPVDVAYDSATTDEDTPVVIDVLANDSDPEEGDFSVTGTTDPSNGTVEINDDGTVTYTPNDGFVGTDTFEYTVTDEAGNESTATVTVVVEEGNEPPIATDDAAETEENEPVVITVLGNDSDPEGEDLTITGTTAPGNGEAFINDDGTITYQPNEGFVGTDTFDYTIVDEAGNESTATVTVVVDENDAPIAVDDASETDEDTPVVIDVLGNDSDPEGDDLTVTGVTDPANGTVDINDDGTVTYTPEPGFFGTDTFDYTVTDEFGNDSTATVTVVVNDVNDAPTAVDDAETTEEDTPVVITVLGNDSDPEGDDLTVTGATDPANGSVTVNDDGTITYTPNDGFVGTDTFDYTIEDEAGNTSTATVTVVVDENDAPVAVDDAETTDEDTPVVITVLGNDSDPEGDDLTVTGATDPANGSVVINDDGTITYTPDENFNGTDTFDYTITDEAGNESTATVTVVVEPVNDAPEAVDDSETTDLNTPVIITVLGNDTDVDGDDLTVTGATDPANGSVTINDDGTITYTPDAGFTGEDTFDYTIVDEEGLESTATVTVTVDDTRDGIVEGTPGDDLIDVTYTGDPDGDLIDNNDQIIPGEGVNDDIVIAGDGDDTVIAGDGNDDVDGGEGNDLIDTSNPDDPAIDVFIGFPGQVVDADPSNDLDSVVGGAGDDTIITGDDADTIEAGTGNDSVESGIDDDVVDLGEGDDIVVDIQGSDYIDGGDGDDTIQAGTNTFSDYIGDDPNLPLPGFPDIITDPNTTDGLDTVFGGAGNDVISTGDDADLIDGGTGNDTIDGGIDDDTITGGTGDDDILGNHGSDSIFGGEGNDVITAGGSTYGGNEPDDTDPVPENDRDYVDGGAGDDTITGGDDDDTLLGGTGDDLLDGGIDEDSLLGGAGNDTILGGDGSDTAEGGAGNDEIDTSGGDNLTDDVDPDPEDDRDLAIGGTGDDTITTGDDDDTILGGAGNDVIDAGIDDDLVDGGAGNDTILAGEGDDTVEGGTGDDSILGGDGCDVIDGGAGGDFIDASGSDPIPDATDPNPLDDCDSILGGAGDDTIITGDDDDTILGGMGNDVIDAGIDDDVVDGGAGNDIIDGGEGADTLLGGDGQDTFINITAGDDVDGGSGQPGTAPDGRPFDYDTLDLTGAAEAVNPGGSLTVVYTSDDREDGFVEFRDADGNITSTMVFEEIENVVPCFTPGTAIATPRGERLVEDLKVGDKIITRDNGIQEIRWMGKRELSGHELARSPNLRPILIQKGSLGNNLPEHDILVSPQHRILINSERTSLYFEETEVLAAAKHLTGLKGVDEVGTLGVTYVHFMFDNHEVVLSNGAWTESFQPGQSVIDGLGTEQREEIFQLFPELQTEEGIKDYTAARRALKKHEAKLLVR